MTMSARSPLLLLLCSLFVFSPTLVQWLDAEGDAWYRHHLVWLAVIIFIYVAARKRDNHGV